MIISLPGLTSPFSYFQQYCFAWQNDFKSLKSNSTSIVCQNENLIANRWHKTAQSAKRTAHFPDYSIWHWQKFFCKWEFAKLIICTVVSENLAKILKPNFTKFCNIISWKMPYKNNGFFLIFAKKIPKINFQFVAAFRKMPSNSPNKWRQM